MDDFEQEAVNDLLSQLKDTNSTIEQAQVERDPIKKEELEDFVIRSGSDLIRDSLETVQTIRNDILAAPDSKNVEAFAALITATSNAIDGMNKIILSGKKNETVLKVKQMDVDAKKELFAAETQTKMALTREEALKMLINKAKPIEAEIVADRRLEN